MALFEGLLGGGGSDPMDIYGDLFTEKQRAALRDQQMTQGLLNAAAVFSKAGQASRLPVSIPWGEAAQALGGSGDEAMARMLKGMQVAEEVRTSRQQREVLAKAAPYVEAIMKRFGLDRPTATNVATQIASAQGGAPAGGPLASNAPPPPPAGPQPSTGTRAPEGLPGGATSAAGAEWLPNLPAAGGRAAGLLPPAQDDPWAQYAGLLGGGTGSQVPFDPTTLDPTGPRGSPDRRIQIELLSGEAQPAGVDVPFPTEANPNKPRSAWAQGVTYDDRAKVPFDPANPWATPEQYKAPGGGLKEVAPTYTRRPAEVTSGGAPNLTGSAWEIANNNFGGMRRPGINASPSQGGFQTFATPEAGLGAISRQLDRYASGATTGKPLSTIREIVSTWAPPSENDTETLIKRASRVMGVADNIPLNLSDPAVKAKLIEATIRNEQGGKLPVDPALIGQVANAPPGTYAASTGSSGRGFSGRIEPLGGDAAPAGTGGEIPGLGVRPEALAALNAMLKMGGIKSDPFGSLLETYYKSPGYLGEAARTEAEARRGVDLKLGPQIKEAETLAELNAKLQLEPKLQAAIETAKNDPRLAFEEKKATIERYTKELEQLRGAGLEPVEVTVRFPGESTPRKITITKAQLPELASGKGIPALGIPQMTGVNLGQPVFTPGQEAEQKGAAESRVKLVQGYREQADLSADAKTTLQGISAEIGNMVHGPFAPAAQLASSYLRVLDPGFNKQVSSYEDLYSNANELVRKAVRQSDPNPSFIQTQMAMDAMPTPSRSPEGLAKITNRMIGVNDHNIARAAAVPNYQANIGNGSVEGFDSWWRKSVSPYAFVFSKMSPDDQAALVSRLNATGQGKREVEKLKTQLGFIKQYGLEQ